MSELDVGILTNQDVQLCKAWVNYNGVANIIRSSFNVSSVTDNGSGDYTVNFTTAMVDTDYSCPINYNVDNTDLTSTTRGACFAKTTSGFEVDIENGNAAPTQADCEIVDIVVFGN